MKKIYALLIALTCCIGVKAQNFNIYPVFTLTFEDTNAINQYFYTDSIIDPLGIWQIGPPHKSFMDTAYSLSNAIVTLLDSMLPPSSMGSFIITLPGIQLGTGQGGLFTFVHQFQFDAAHGGGYLEFSVDTGRHWHPIYTGTDSLTCGNGNYWIGYGNGFGYGWPEYDTVDGQRVPMPTWWDNVHKDTTALGIPYFTGIDSTWIYDSIALPNIVYGSKTSLLTQFMFRFTAYTDSLSPSLGGWLIDNISYANFTIACPGGINEINSAHLHVYPDPATDEFFVSLLNEPESDYVLTLYDLSGRVVMQTSFTGQELTMQRGSIDAGSYLIQVMDRRTQNTFQKRIMFE